MMKIIYSGVFLDEDERNRLLEMFPPIYPKIFVDHTTITYRPTQDDCLKLPIGERVDFEIISEVKDDKCQTLVVKSCKNFSLQDNKPHITVSTLPEVEPKYSKMLLEKNNFTNFAPIKSFGLVGVFTDKGKIFDQELLK